MDDQIEANADEPNKEIEAMDDETEANAKENEEMDVIWNHLRLEQMQRLNQMHGRLKQRMIILKQMWMNRMQKLKQW
jgi:hypothetical protein